MTLCLAKLVRYLSAPWLGGNWVCLGLFFWPPRVFIFIILCYKRGYGHFWAFLKLALNWL